MSNVYVTLGNLGYAIMILGGVCIGAGASLCVGLLVREIYRNPRLLLPHMPSSQEMKMMVGLGLFCLGLVSVSVACVELGITF